MAQLIPNAGTATPSTSKVVTGAQVGFKVGTQATVDNMISSFGTAQQTAQTLAKHGTFYLTEDSHRLYIGNSDGSLSAINEGITVVSSVNELPSLATEASAKAHIGRFYYIASTGYNVLCIATYDIDGTAKWVQINPDTYLATGKTIGESPLTAANNPQRIDGVDTTGVDLTSTIQDTGGRAIAHKWTIRGLKNINVTYADDATDQWHKTINLSVPDSGIYKQWVKTDGQDSNGNPIVKVILKEYASIALKEADTDGTGGTTVGEINFQSGNGGVRPVLLSDNKTIRLDGGGFAASGAGSAASVALTEVMDETQSPAVGTGTYTLTVTDGMGNSVSTKLHPSITIGDTQQTIDFTHTTTGSGSNAVNNFNAVLPVYTKSEIDAKLTQATQNFDSMYFAGTIGSGTGISGTAYSSLTALHNATTLTSGATFKMVDTESAPNWLSGISSGSDVKPGDLIIVTGTEGTTGYLNPSNATFTYIPSGDDDDIYYTPDFSDSTNKTVKWTMHTTGAGNGNQHKIVFAQGTDITVGSAYSAPTAQNSQTATNTITIGHATYGTPTSSNSIVYQTPHASEVPNGTAQNAIGVEEFEAIDSITTQNGHVTAYSTKKIRLYSKKKKKVTTTVAADSSNANQSAVLLSKLYDNNDNTYLGANGFNNKVRFSSETLTISANAAGALASTAAGASTAADIKIDMIWGSF